MATLDIKVYKAQRMGAPTPDLQITAVDELPEQGTLEMSRATFRAEGREIARGLIACLPGGTIDAVLLALFERQCSLLHVTYGAAHGA